MNKNLIIITLIVVLLCGIFILSSQESKQADNEINEQKNQYHIKGTIYNIDNGRILVGEELASEGYTGNFEDIEGQAVWFSIGDETEIKYNNETQSFDNLEIGMQSKYYSFIFKLEIGLIIFLIFGEYIETNPIIEALSPVYFLLGINNFTFVFFLNSLINF
jgi:hypothetical protein